VARGIPATRPRGLRVIGVDFSAVQLRRARRLVPAARLPQADMTALHLARPSLDAVVCFCALIHVPPAEQQALSRRTRRPAGPAWPRDCGCRQAPTSATGYSAVPRLHRTRSADTSSRPGLHSQRIRKGRISSHYGIIIPRRLVTVSRIDCRGSRRIGP
jgi:SAM-dependent methyltransferase